MCDLGVAGNFAAVSRPGRDGNQRLKAGPGLIVSLFWEGAATSRRRLASLQVTVNKGGELRLGDRADLGGFDVAVLE